MKLSVLLVTTIAVGMATAYPRPNRDDIKEFHLERLNRFLGMLPEDLRQEVESAFRWAVTNGERPHISELQRDQIREHMTGLKDVHQEKLNRFLSMLPEDLRLEVEALIEQSAANGEFPRAPEELRSKIREHFTALKEARRQRLDKFLSMLPEDLRQEVELLLQQPLIDGERPRAPEELRDKIREHFGNLKEAHRERLDKFMDLLPEDLRLEVEALIQQSVTDGEHPRAPEELRNKIREHFTALKEARKQRLDKFLSMLPQDLRQEVELLLQQPLLNGERPRAPEELRNKIREHFGSLNDHEQLNTLIPQELHPIEVSRETYRDQFTLLMDLLPQNLRLEVEAEFAQGPVKGQRPSDQLQTKLREYFWRLLPAGLKEQLAAVFQQAQNTGTFPEMSQGLRDGLHQFLQLLRTPQLH